jgi:hypothetical protein
MYIPTKEGSTVEHAGRNISRISYDVTFSRIFDATHARNHGGVSVVTLFIMYVRFNKEKEYTKNILERVVEKEKKMVVVL